MLQAFTWQQFLVAALILTLIWYIGVFLLYYRRKAQELFSPKAKQPEKLKREWEEEFEDEPDEDDDLIGAVRESDGVSSAEMDTLLFAPKAEDPYEQRDTQLGIVPDVIEELKGIFHVLENEGGTKEDLISLFALVSSKYPQIKGTANQQALNEYIRENVSFPISDEELDQLWP